MGAKSLVLKMSVRPNPANDLVIERIDSPLHHRSNGLEERGLVLALVRGAFRRSLTVDWPPTNLSSPGHTIPSSRRSE